MKRTIFTLVILLLGFNCLLAQLSGNGTANDPWLISSTADLSTLSANSTYWGGHIKQTADIDAPAGSFSPIGNYTTEFTGSYDGDGHTIDGLYYNASPLGFYGLFGRTRNCNIIDLGVINVNISAHDYVGGLVGQNIGGTVSNCYSTGSVTGTYSVGGLIGTNYGNLSTVTGCYSTCSVTGSGWGNSVGGLVGYNYRGTVSNCYSTGSVTGTHNVGGLVGYNYRGTVSNSFWDTQTSGQSSSDGGTGKTTAEMKTQSTFTSAGWDFDVDGISAGHNGVWIMAGYPHLQMEWSTTISDVVGLQMAALDLDEDYTLSGNIDASATSTWNYNGSTYDGFSPIGNSTTNFTGSYDGDGHTIDGLYIAGSADNCGLFGRNHGNIIDLGVINVNISARIYVGGLAGVNFGTVSNCYSTGSVNASGHFIGGLIGQNYNTGTVSNCYSTGSVTGTYAIGGLVGVNSGPGTVSNCYSTSSVNGSQGNIGGLVGAVGGSNPGTVSNCYSTGSVTGSGEYVGGLVGKNNGGTVSSSFWDKQTSGKSTSSGGEGKTTAEMKMQSTFTNAGWDFTSIWQIFCNYPDLINNPRPPDPIPCPPVLLQPTNGSIILTLTPLLDWNDVDGASNYNVQVSLYDDFSPLLYESTDLTESQHPIPVELLTTNTVYYWRANASNSAGASPWSEVCNFITYSTPSEKTEMLITTIDSLKNAGILNAGNANSLKSKLNNALDKISQGKINAAINILNAFKNQINALVNSNKLTPAQGEALVERTDALIEQISGENIQQIVQIPKEFKLDQNYPNPFNPMTRIDYSLPFDSKVSLQIFDALGREVITLVDDNQRAGYYTIDFNASNLASGIYFYRMLAGDFSAKKKMVVIK